METITETDFGSAAYRTAREERDTALTAYKEAKRLAANAQADFVLLKQDASKFGLSPSMAPGLPRVINALAANSSNKKKIALGRKALTYFEVNAEWARINFEQACETLRAEERATIDSALKTSNAAVRSRTGNSVNNRA